MILIVAAMEKEIEEIIKHQKDNTLICLTGIGKVNAAAKLTEYLIKYNIDSIINIGFAGGSSKYQVGDIILVSEATYHDFNLTLFGYEHGQVPGFPTFFKSNHDLVQKIESIMPNLHKEKLFTGDYFMTENLAFDFVCDMEGAALYQTAFMHQIPIVSVKVISDIVGMEKHYESYRAFEEKEGAKALYQIYQKLV
jgi:adenosylhomocysteine nucleosidase